MTPSTAVRDSRGTIAIEVLMALLPLLFAFLGITQLAILKMGQLVVQHAANRAVRSAVVILDDDPDYYDGADRYDLDAGAARDEDGLVKFAGEVNDAYNQLLGGGEVQGGARLQAIRHAAFHPLAVLTPDLSGVLGTSDLKTEVGGSPWARIFVYSLAYNRGAGSVRVESEHGGSVRNLRPSDPVVVKVDYLMNCGVPLVSRFMCHRGVDLLEASLLLSNSESAIEILDRLQNVASPILRDAILASGGSYRLLSAEATLPNQGATYH